MIPWQLFALEARDAGSPQIRPLKWTDTQSLGIGVQAATSQWICPADHVALVTLMSAFINNATDQHLRCNFQVAGYTGNSLNMRKTQDVGLLDKIAEIYTGAPLFMMMPQEYIDITTELSVVSTVPWTSHASLAGILIPRGNLSLT